MNEQNILQCRDRQEFRAWLMEHAVEKALAHLIDETGKGRMYGEWNDYGRLSN